MWNFGDLFDAVARVVPSERPALVFGEAVLRWGEFDRRTNNLARALLAQGLVAGDRIAILSRNHPAYIETAVAALKARLVYVNLNYRYTAPELAYVLNDCGARALVFQQEFSMTVDALEPLTPALAVWTVIAGEPGGAPRAPGRLDFEALAQAGDGSPLRIARSPDDTYLVYTGGTTGRPKGVIWTNHATRASQLESPLIKTKPADLAGHVKLVAENPAPGCVIPACPLMHGAGINSSMAELVSGGTVVALTSRRFDAGELWAAVERNRATRILVVGDAFARPMADYLDTHPAFDLRSLKVISSSGLSWSSEVKAALLRHLPETMMLDIFGSTEAAGLGYAISTRDNILPTGLFEPGTKTVLIDPESDRLLDDHDLNEGFVARSGDMASGYFNDAAKTAEVYRVIGGVRYAIPGDVAQRTNSGQLRLVGRGALCINTGGEKVFPEEVEIALRSHSSVIDALVIGLPDPVWGSVVTALVQPGVGFDQEELLTALKQSLAAYKLPKRILRVEQIPRHENGKSDYARARDIAKSDAR